MASLSRQLSQWIIGLRYEDLPAEVVDRAKGVTLHALASVLIGSQTSAGHKAVELITEEEDGRELVLGYFGPGEFVGELGLFIENDHREVILRTRTACELAEIGHERFYDLLLTRLSLDAPKLLYAIGAQISRRLLDTSRKAGRLAFLDVTDRIVRALHDLAKEPEAMSHPQGTQLRVSRQELSRLVGCSREMAGRVLKKLQVDGKLHARGKTVVLYGTRG